MLTSELYQLRYILFIELSLLLILAILGLIPFLVLSGFLLLIIILIAVYKFPVAAIYILIFSILADSFIPIKRNITGPSLLSVELFFVAFLGMGIIWFLTNLNKPTEIPNLILVWIPFLLWSLLIGLVVAVDQYRVVTYWKNFFAGFFTLILVYYTVINRSQLKSIMFAIVIWGILLSLIEIKVVLDIGGLTVGLIGLFLKKNLLTLGWGRSNYLAAFFVIIIPFTIGFLFYTKSKKMKLFLTFAIILMSSALVLTLSRGGVLAFLIALIILFSRLLKPKTLIPLILVASVVVTVLLLNPLTIVLFERIFELGTSASVYSRINFYIDTWNTFLKHPITGVGIANLGYYSTFILPPTESPSAHNIVLGALGEIGIVGSILYFTIFILLIKKVYLEYKFETNESLRLLRWGTISALLGGLIHTLVEPTLEGIQFSILFWVISGISLKINLFSTSEPKKLFISSE